MSKLRTHTVRYMWSCFEHRKSRRLTNSNKGLSLSTNIEVCGIEKHVICYFSNGYLSGSSETREMGFAQMMHNKYCLLKLSYLEHALYSVNVSCYNVAVSATVNSHR